ncbi:MAG: NAD(P)/FAD-dependent oxidoreductase [Elainellaceae cyanobacterium]
MAQKRRVIIIGAGFGGLQAAQSLAHCDAEVLLIDRNNYSTFVPLLYQVAGAQIEPELIAYPIRNVGRHAPNLKVLVGEVSHIDFNQQVIETHGTLIAYDYLVVATGSYTQFPRGVRPSAAVFSLRTLEEAIAIRNHVVQCFEAATREPDEIRRQQLLTFMVIGGGPTGVEMAGMLAELWEAVQRDYPTLDPKQIQIRLVQSGDRLLPHFPANLSLYTLQKLRRMGVDVQLNIRVQQIEADRLQLNNGDRYSAATILWTAGQQAMPPDMTPALDTAPRQKLEVLPTLQLTRHHNVYAIGDVSHLLQQPLKGLAPEALQQGVAVARNIRRQLRGKAPKPFRYLDKGRLAIIGNGSGVGKIGPLQLKGGLPWLMWLAVHWVYLPGFRNRVFVLISWLHAYLWGDRAVRLVLSGDRPASKPVKTTS